MLNVLRLTSGVLKNLQLSDLAKLLFISSTSSTTTTSQQPESTKTCVLVEKSSSVIHHIDTSDCSVSAEQESYDHDRNENTTITSSASPTSAAVTFSVIGSAGGINLKSEWCSTKSTFQETIDDSIKSYMVQNSNKEEQSCEIIVMSSPNSVSEKINCCDTISATTIVAAEISSLSPSSSSQSSTSIRREGSHTSSCSASSSPEKPCFTSSLADILKFLELVGNLKHVKRTGWVLRDVKDCESISGHMYRMSMMTFLLDGTEGLDRTKCMELALVHDLAESLVGDITPFCGISKEEKKLREMKAMEDICKLIEPRGNRIYELFMEYEENETPESKFVKDLDRLDMVLQAFEYEKRDDCILKHQEFFDSTNGKFSHPFVVKLVNEIYSQRQALAEVKNNQQQKQEQQQNHHHQQQQQNGFVTDSNGDENVVQKKVSSS